MDSAEPAIERLWLTGGGPPVFVAVHRPAAPERDTAVLICPPFGWDEMCSYRGRRDWAQALAAAGFACARVDLPGTGDSFGTPGQPGLFQAWRETVATAAGWLRERAGAGRVAALGLGLGGLLAGAAVAQGAPIDDLILWGVPARGRTLLRELRAYAGVVAAPFPADDRPLPEGELELTGFRLSAETVTALDALELSADGLRARSGAGVRRVLLLGRDGLPADRRLERVLRAAGVELTVADGPDWGVLVGDPQQNGPPRATIALTQAWLAGQPAANGSGRPRVASSPRASAAVDRGGIRETSFALSGELADAFAVLTEPSGVAGRSGPAPLAAVWLNPGALHHTGPSRMWVELARRWAALGVPTLRVDLPGIGEAGGPAPRPLPDGGNYIPRRGAEARMVLDQLVARGVAGRFVLGGLCSGAYWALHAALGDARVAGALLVNLYAVRWSEALVIERGREQTLNALLARISGGRLRADGALRPQGGVFYHPAGDACGGRLSKLSPARLHSALWRPVQRSQRGEVEQALNQLRDQETETLLLFSRGEGLHDQLRHQRIAARGGRWPNLTAETLPTRDHMFRALWLQSQVHEALDRALERVRARAVPGDLHGASCASMAA